MSCGLLIFEEFDFVVGAFVEGHLERLFYGDITRYSIFLKDWVSLERLFIEVVSVCLFMMDKTLALMIFLWNFTAKWWFVLIQRF